MLSDAEMHAEAERLAPPDAVKGAYTRMIRERGCSILQVHRLAPSEAAHVAALLDLMQPPERACIVDAGCGIGEVARLMRQQRPDLDFILVNRSAEQLAMAPACFPRVLASFDAMPQIRDGGVDGVMFLYALGHGELDRTLAEAARVTRPGGLLFVYDLEAPDPLTFLRDLAYVARPAATIAAAALRHGFRLELEHRPERTSTDAFRAALGEDALALFDGTRTIALRFRRMADA